MLLSIDTCKTMKKNKTIYSPSFRRKNKEARRFLFELPKMAATYSPTNAVPSALLSLTTLFGMGRGGTSAL